MTTVHPRGRTITRPIVKSLKLKDQLVLLRHGETAWTQETRFTGWVDVPLTAEGVAASQHAAQLIHKHGYKDIDVIYTSVLSRSIKTAWAVMEELDLLYVPVHKDYRLVERHYGALTGVSKKESTLLFGAEQLKAWRRGLDDAPPPITESHPYWNVIINDPRFSNVEEMPLTESLLDVIKRLMPLWENHIAKDLREGKRVLVCGHSNSLRALMTVIEQLSNEQVLELNVPNSFPIVYDLDSDLRPRRAKKVLGDKLDYELACRAVAEEASVSPLRQRQGSVGLNSMSRQTAVFDSDVSVERAWRPHEPKAA